MEIGQKVKIISDSTCDLSQELTEKYDIDILPLHICWAKTSSGMAKIPHPIAFLRGRMQIRQRRKPLRRLWRMPKCCCSRMLRPAVR